MSVVPPMALPYVCPMSFCQADESAVSKIKELKKRYAKREAFSSVWDVSRASGSPFSAWPWPVLPSPAPSTRRTSSDADVRRRRRRRAAQSADVCGRP